MKEVHLKNCMREKRINLMIHNHVYHGNQSNQHDQENGISELEGKGEEKVFQLVIL